MENIHPTPPFGAPQSSCTPKTKEKKLYAVDSHDRMALFLTLGMGILLAALFLGPGLPGLGITLGTLVWYGILLLLRGKKSFESWAAFWLFLAVMALSLTFSLWSNLWLRGWNLIFLLGLMVIQTEEWFQIGRKPWFAPAMLLERGALTLEGLFGNFPAAAAVVGTIGKPEGKRTRGVLFGLALALPAAAVALALLLEADGYFAYVVGRLVSELYRIFGEAVLRLLLGLLLTPFLFGVCYALRHAEKREETRNSAMAGLDPLVPTMVLGVLDLIYIFFLAVQSAALFGGPDYLEGIAGLSYAEYARSGFFQLVFVAGLNLALVLSACQFSRQEGRGWTGVRLLSTAMIAMSGVILLSAAYRMTLYVQVYGLSFKRFLTYWGMVMLVIFLAAAALKVWKKEFGFFRILLTVSIVGWLALNVCNVDRIVAEYNVALYQSQETALLDMDYMVNSLSYDALDVLERVKFPYQAQNAEMECAIQVRRAQAAREASHWQTWSLSAYLAAEW